MQGADCGNGLYAPIPERAALIPGTGRFAAKRKFPYYWAKDRARIASWSLLMACGTRVNPTHAAICSQAV